MKFSLLSIALALAGCGTCAMAYTGFSHPPYETYRPPMPTLAPEIPAIYAEQAVVKPSSPTSDVAGVAFDRIVQIWLENVDYRVSFAFLPSLSLERQGCLGEMKMGLIGNVGRRGERRHAVDRQSGDPADQLLGW